MTEKGVVHGEGETHMPARDAALMSLSRQLILLSDGGMIADGEKPKNEGISVHIHIHTCTHSQISEPNISTRVEFLNYEIRNLNNEV